MSTTYIMHEKHQHMHSCCKQRMHKVQKDKSTCIEYDDRVYTCCRLCTTHSCNKHNTINSSNSSMEEEQHHHHHHQQPSCLLLTIMAILFKLLECHTNIIIFLNHITLNNIIINGLLLLSSFTHPIPLLHLLSKDHTLLSQVRTYFLLLLL